MNSLKRTITLQLLRLIKSLSTKANESNQLDLSLVAMDEVIEQIASSLFEINGIHQDHTGTLFLSLSDYLTGAITEAEFMGLLHGGWCGHEQNGYSSSPLASFTANS